MSEFPAFSGDQAAVVELLMHSVSENEQKRSEAYARILELEANPAFLSTLVDVSYLDDMHLSKLAFICIKNAITRIRGASAARVIRGPNTNVTNVAIENLKEKLYSVLQADFASDNRVIPKDLALIVRQLCRWNYPQGWMNLHKLLEVTLDAAASGEASPKCTLNCLMITYHIFKEKTRMKLMRDRSVTVKLASVYYPYVAKLWLNNWLLKWDGGTISYPKVLCGFNDIDVSTSRYLDSLLTAIYTHGPRDIYQRKELTDLLKLVCAKQKLHLELLNQSQELQTRFRKNARRLLRCIGSVFEYEATIFAFVDPSSTLSSVFEYLATGSSTQVVSECIKLLCTVFKSPFVNNERYMQQYHDLHADGSASKGQTKRVDEDVVFFESFEEMKAQYEMAASSSSSGLSIQSLKKSSSPTKGPYSAIGSIAEWLSRQATFLFWDTITAHGGIMRLVEFLRERYLTLSPNYLKEWDQEAIPMEDPGQTEIHELIDAMKVTGQQMFEYIVNGIISTNCKLDFLRLDSYLSLYTISYSSLASIHSSKHYLTILDSLKGAMNIVDQAFVKLLIFRCSRVVNAWTKRINLFEEQVKCELLRYLLHCLCFEGDTISAVNLRAQHLVPFHQMYCKTIDQPFWDALRKGTDLTRVVSSIHTLTKIEIPVVQHRALELLCKICLEFDDESNNFGKQLSDLITTYSGSQNDLSITTSLLQTSLSFLNSLDWQRCYKEESYINSHLLRFMFQLLFKMLVFREVPVSGNMPSTSGVRITKCIVSINNYSELEEDTLTLWLCLLRVLPNKLEAVEHELRNDILALFPLLLSYLMRYDSDESHGKMQICSGPAISLDIVTEYLTILLDYIKTYTSEMAGSPDESRKLSAEVCDVNGEVILRMVHLVHGTMDFSITKMQLLCLQCLKYPSDDPLRQGAIRLLNILMFGFCNLCTSNKDVLAVLRELLFLFCKKLHEAGKPSEEKPSELRRCKFSCISHGTDNDSHTPWQCSKLDLGVIESISGLVPIICRWGLDSQSSFNEALVYALERLTLPSPEILLVALIHASEQCSRNAYLQLGMLICSCLMTNGLALKYGKLKLFIHHRHPVIDINRDEHSIEPRDNPHQNLYGVYLPAYMLRVVNSIVAGFLESKKSYCFSITKASLMNDGDDYSLPPSKRFHIFANASSTYNSTAFPMSDLPEHELFYGALNSAVGCLTHLSYTLGTSMIPQSMEFFLEESSCLNPKISDMINASRSPNN